MNELINNISYQNPDLNKAEVEGLLYELKQNPEMSNSELIRLCGIAQPIIKRFRSSLVELNYDEINPQPYLWSLTKLEDKEVEQKLIEIRKKYNLEPKREYDQFFATPASSVGKAMIVKEKDLINGNSIALIGDDDLVSIAISLIENSYNKITIFEVDPDITKTITQIATDYGFTNLEIIQQDVRTEFARQYISRYDVVLIDPPYTRSGVQLFLHRALELNNKGYVLLNFGAGRKFYDKVLKIQDIISSFNLVIEDKLNKFTRYYGAETVGSASSIYLLKTTPSTTLNNSLLSEHIYTFEDDPLEKFPYVDHFVFKVKKIDDKLVNSKSALLNVFGRFCKKHKLKVVDTKVTKFKGNGLSITFILASSNLLVHTWPEHNALHIDLVTCSPIFNKQELAYTLSNLLDTKYVETKRVE